MPAVGARRASLALLFVVLTAASASAETLRLRWDANPEPNIAGYVVRYGTTSGSYDHEIAVGNVTEYALSGLAWGRRYFVAVAAVDSSGVSSPYSPELSIDFPEDVLNPQLDLMLQHDDTQHLAMWRINGRWLLDGVMLQPSAAREPGWRVAATGDLDADGNRDLLWRHADGALAVWFMDGPRMRSGSSLTVGASPGWEIRAMADVDLDGRSDIIWQHVSTGAVAAWLMDGLQFRNSVTIGQPGPAWQLAAACDLSGDGAADFIWQHRSEDLIAGWTLQAGRMLDNFLLSPSGAGDMRWRLAGCSDTDGDGSPDLLWRDQGTPFLAIWKMRGSRMIDGFVFSIPLPDARWRTLP